jgi:hypothetical protein
MIKNKPEDMHCDQDKLESLWFLYGLDHWEAKMFWEGLMYEVYQSDLAKLTDDDLDNVFDLAMGIKDELADFENVLNDICMFIALKVLFPKVRFKKQFLVNNETVRNGVQFLNNYYRKQEPLSDELKKYLNEIENE